MDDRRFDAFTRALGQRGSRRAALKTLLGLGGIAAVGRIAIGDDVQAAPRPTPVSRPPRCPGSQTPCATGCCCPSGTQNCGGDCCPTGDYSVCCDGACCNGICYGEELCCPLGQLVCGGVCLPPGACCTDFDCTSGRCLNNACVPFTPTSTTVPPTNTAVPPTNTAVPPTNTAVPPTTTPTTTPSNTPLPPTNTSTNTPVPPSPTATRVPASAQISFVLLPSGQCRVISSATGLVVGAQFSYGAAYRVIGQTAETSFGGGVNFPNSDGSFSTTNGIVPTTGGPYEARVFYNQVALGWIYSEWLPPTC